MFIQFVLCEFEALKSSNKTNLIQVVFCGFKLLKLLCFFFRFLGCYDESFEPFVVGAQFRTLGFSFWPFSFTTLFVHVSEIRLEMVPDKVSGRNTDTFGKTEKLLSVVKKQEINHYGRGKTFVISSSWKKEKS
ncbi:MAG: hypothetical protein EBR01_02010 [Proteobacteria bacterium]|nr:hypothetical protein [Pseudomonadota bacterium]